MTSIVINADWDPEAEVWVATSDDILGLVTEADTLETLRSKIGPIMEDLIELNKLNFDLEKDPVNIVARDVQRATRPRAE